MPIPYSASHHATPRTGRDATDAIRAVQHLSLRGCWLAGATAIWRRAGVDIWPTYRRLELHCAFHLSRFIATPTGPDYRSRRQDLTSSTTMMRLRLPPCVAVWLLAAVALRVQCAFPRDIPDLKYDGRVPPNDEYQETVYGPSPYGPARKPDGYGPLPPYAPDAPYAGKPHGYRPKPDGPVTEDIRHYCHNVMDEAKSMTERRLDEEKHAETAPYTPYTLVSNFLHTEPYAKTLTYSAICQTSAIKLIQERYGMTANEAIKTLHEMDMSSLLKQLPGEFQADADLPAAPDHDYCPYPNRIVCDEHTTFRTHDGSCNNLQTSLIGRSMTPFRRILPARYADGLSEMRRSVTGHPLPGARAVSLHLFPDVNKPSPRTTLALVFFSQFTDHDLTRTAAFKIPTQNKDQMGEVECGVDGCEHGKDALDPCWPIPIPDDDSDFAANRCLKFVRSMQVPPLNCEIGPREQLNQVTHWLDGSQVYGSNKDDSDAVRDLSDPRRGRLAVSTPYPHRSYRKPLLPANPDAMVCNGRNETIQCFKAGDTRPNENGGIAVFHVVFVRQHNMLEEGLNHLNPHWDGERLFQESRRIVVASLQHIVFNELLPLLLGPELVRHYQVDLLDHGYFKGYDPSIDARIPNEFAAAAFRYGHTLLQERLLRGNEYGQFDNSLFISQTFNSPVPLYDDRAGGVDALIRGLAHAASQTFDWFFTKQISRSLFTARPPHGVGHDLLSINIQRGRDHGIPTYNDFREWCGLGRARTFQDLAGEITDHEFLDVISRFYRHVDDIDLFAGGVSETPMKGAVLGPTFACVIGATFRSLRFGDRFWYENPEAGFTPDQLQEIRKVRLSRIMCVNGDAVEFIQPLVFVQPSVDNEPVPCQSLPDIDLRYWRSEY